MKRIYLDHAATTPLDPRVAQAMRDFELQYFGNPSSTHREGQQARALIDTARATVAKFINAQPQEIIFTSGATEANNLAIQGVVKQASVKKPHVITTLLEHQSVYNTVKELQKRGVITASFVQPDKNGMIKAQDVIKKIKDNTVLISVIFVSNEIGSVLPIREIGQQITDHPASTRRRGEAGRSQIIFHVDAVQAAKFYNLNVEKLGCDLLTLSAHKLYGPKGIGALYAKTGLRMQNLMLGGSQEYGKRPGTQNTTGIVGFAKAVELLGTLENRQDQAKKINKLRDRLIYQVRKISKTDLNGPEGENRTADNVSLTFYDVDQDALMTALDLAGISASTGSACVSGSSEPSHVIEALGKIANRPAATVRFTLGQETTSSEIIYAIKTLKKLISKLRS